MLRKKIITSFIIVVILLSVFLIIRYTQYILVWHANPQINVDGIKIMMTENEVKRLLGEEEEYVPGYAGCAFNLRYHSKGIYLDFLGDVDTDFYHKVNRIKITNAAYSIFNVEVGDNYEESLNAIQQYRFTQQKEEVSGYWRMNMYIILEKNDDKVESITIGVRDRVAGTRVY